MTRAKCPSSPPTPVIVVAASSSDPLWQLSPLEFDGKLALMQALAEVKWLDNGEIEIPWDDKYNG